MAAEGGTAADDYIMFDPERCVDEIRAAALGNTGDIPTAKWSVAMSSSGNVYWMAFDRV